MTAVQPSLSIVIPVYNEPYWIRRTVEDATAAVARSAFDDVEFVIVDDGSDDETRKALEEFETHIPVRVLRQANSGRFAARATGIKAAKKEFVLLLDSRVSLSADALEYLGRALAEPAAPVAWNGHVELDSSANLFARFWTVPSALFWSRYLAEPRLTTFGAEDFDWFPKGTGCFFAPRAVLLAALSEFVSLYDDVRNANDDAVLLRSVARGTRIAISPLFAATYQARTTFRSFLRHAFHRGTVFVDAFARPGTRFFPFVVVFFPASILTSAFMVARPRIGVVGAIVAVPAGFVVGLASRRSTRDALAFAVLAPPFTVAYAGGMWRGAALVLSARHAAQRR